MAGEVFANQKSAGIDAHYIQAVGDSGTCWYKLPSIEGGKLTIKTVALKDRRGRSIGFRKNIIINENLLSASKEVMRKMLVPTVAVNHLLVLTNGKIFCTTSMISATYPYPSYLDWEASLTGKGDAAGRRELAITASVSGVSFDAADAGFISTMPALGTRPTPANSNYFAFLDSIAKDANISGGIDDVLYKLTPTLLTFGGAGDAPYVTLNLTASATNDYYKNWIINWNNQWRTITGYVGATKVATLDHSFGSDDDPLDPDVSDVYNIGQFVTLKNFGSAALTAKSLAAKEKDRWSRSVCKNTQFDFTFNRIQTIVASEIAELTAQLNHPNDFQILFSDGTIMCLFNKIGVVGDFENQDGMEGLEHLKYTLDGILTEEEWNYSLGYEIELEPPA